MKLVFNNKKDLLNYAKDLFGKDSKQYKYLVDIADQYDILLLENVYRGFILDKK